MACIDVDVACILPLRRRAFSEGDMAFEQAETMDSDVVAVPRRTFWELTSEVESVDFEKCNGSDADGSEATTTLRWDSDCCDGSDTESTSGGSSSPCSPPGFFCAFQPAQVGGAFAMNAHAATKTGRSKARRSRRRGGSVWKDAMQRQEECEVTQEERTTLLLKNLPLDCTTDKLAELLDTEGFFARYDFAYAPIDFTQQRAFGYAFINFCTPNDACDAMDVLDGSLSWGDVALEVQWSDPHQGLGIQISRYQNSPVMHMSIPLALRPALFEDGIRKEFPAPTKAIKAPRSRRRGDSAEHE